MFNYCISMFVHVFKGMHLDIQLKMSLLRSLAHLWPGNRKERKRKRKGEGRGKETVLSLIVLSTDASVEQSTVIVQNSL